MSVMQKMRELNLKRILTFMAGIVGIPALVIFSVYHLNQSGFFNISQIEILVDGFPGQSLYLKPKIEELDQAFEVYRGESLWEAELGKASALMAKYPWVQSYQISRGWPQTLVVKVKPYEVKMLYLSLNGSLLPVIEDGKLLSAVDTSLAPDVPILHGGQFGAKPELRKKAVQVLSEIPVEGNFSRKAISEMTFDSRDGFLATLVKSGARVKLGEEMISQKSSRLAAVIDYLDSRQMQPKVIDANLSRKIHVQCDRPKCGALQ